MIIIMNNILNLPGKKRAVNFAMQYTEINVLFQSVSFSVVC